MPKVQPIRTPASKPAAKPRGVHQFLVVLNGSDPLIWRRIEVPEAYTFWDLHVAIQDAVGWQDCHLHEFRLLDPKGTLVSIGIPADEEPDDRPMLPGWKEEVSKYFVNAGWHVPPAMYAYDFGDDWEHTLVHEGMTMAEPGARYPRCVGGARKGPPEDCGGVHGFAEFLAAIADPGHPEHESMREWVGRTTRATSPTSASDSTTRRSVGAGRSAPELVGRDT